MNNTTPSGPEFTTAPRPNTSPSAWSWGQTPEQATTPSMPTTPRELTGPAVPPHSTPSYGTAQAFTGKPRRRGSAIAGVLAVALLAVGGGGAVGAATTIALQADAPGFATNTTNATQVVQADPSNPDWAATAAAVSDAVVAIQVSGMSGSGEGSGVILDTAGNIVTNNHVIAGAGGRTQIIVMIGTRAHEARVVGTDPSTDLAVIKLVDPPEDLATVAFGDSSALRVGDPVMAIGNPLGLSDTVTTGIVSAIDRPVTTREVSNTIGDSGNGTVVTAAIQTNAAINPGNSGGALVNASGELVGITSSIATLTSSASGQGGSIGIGFAIPAVQVQDVVEQLLTTGVAVHAQLGISATDVENSAQLGAQVVEVLPGSAAAAAGLRLGDVITALDGRPITSSEGLVALVRSSQVGQSVELSVVRGAQTLELTATLKSAS